MSDGVEWSLHCCSVLGTLSAGVVLPGARLAEFHDVRAAYLAKHLQALSSAGIVESTTGRRGGYRLARPAGEVSLLDVVLAVDGDQPAFRCAEIRQRGPSAVGPKHDVRPCGIARAVWDAESAWRDSLRSVASGKAIEWMEKVLR